MLQKPQQDDACTLAVFFFGTLCVSIATIGVAVWSVYQ